MFLSLHSKQAIGINYYESSHKTFQNSFKALNCDWEVLNFVRYLPWGLHFRSANDWWNIAQLLYLLLTHSFPRSYLVVSGVLFTKTLKLRLFVVWRDLISTMYRIARTTNTVFVSLLHCFFLSLFEPFATAKCLWLILQCNDSTKIRIVLGNDKKSHK